MWKKTLWTLAFLTVLGCADSKMPKKERDIFKQKYDAVETPKSKETSQELSKTLDLNLYMEEEESEDFDISENDKTWSNQELSEVLDISFYAINWQNLERQAQIKNLISQIKEQIILWDLTKPNVAITIDDGYWVESIKYMLDLFEEYDVKATFFVIWDCLKLHPELWKKAVQQWHEICNHTATHSKYFKTWNEPERFERELLWWERIAKSTLWEGYLIKMKKNHPFFRFPWMYGIRVKAYLDILKKHGYIPIWWWYTENPKDGVVNNGEIFLWHFKDQDKNNVRRSLELALQNGKHIKPISDLIFTDEYKTPIDWTNYAKKIKEAQAKQYE